MKILKEKNSGITLIALVAIGKLKIFYKIT